MEFINKQLPIYLPLRYPLLYLYSELSWRINYPLINRAWVPRDYITDVDNTIGEDSMASNSKADKADTIY